LAVKITQNGETKVLPEVQEVNDRIKYLIKNSGGIFVFESRDKFPITGLSNALYRAEDTNIIYYWGKKPGEDTKNYHAYGSSTSVNIQLINGGDAEVSDIKL
jgi:hypothetical protein